MSKIRTLHFLEAYKNFFYNHRKSIMIYLFLCSIFIPFSWQQDVYDWYYLMGKSFIEGKNVYSPINTYAIVVRGESGRWGYPPLFLPIFSIVYLISAFFGVPFHIIFKIPIVIINLFAAKKIEDFANSPSAVELFLFNPLIFISTIIQGFLEVLVVYFILLALENIRKSESAVYIALSSLCKQTTWPLIPFFFAINHGKKYLLTFTIVILAGLSPFLLTNFNDITYSIILQHQVRAGIMPFSYLLSLFNLEVFQYEGFMYAQYAVIGVQLSLIMFLAIYTARKINEKMDKVEILKYFLLFEMVSLSFLYLLVPLHPHFLTYIIIPIIILTCVYPKVKYLYIIVTIAGYISFTLDQGLRHNIFHYQVWSGPNRSTPPIYLGYYHLGPIIWFVGGFLSIVIYVSCFYIFHKIWRRGTNCKNIGD